MKQIENLNIRPASDNDADDIQSIIKECFLQYSYQGLIFDIEEMPDLKYPSSSLKHNPPKEIGIFKVATIKDNIIATIAAQAIDDLCEIKRLYVHPQFQKYGIGKIITLNIIKQLNNKSLFLWSDSRFTNAHKLYQKLGFSLQIKFRTLNDKSCSKELLFTKNFKHNISKIQNF